MQNLDYKDVYLVPSYSECRSRRDLDASVEFLGHKFMSCVIPANMKACIDFDMAEKLSEAGYFYVLHRFYDYQEIKEWIAENQNLKTISISLGAQIHDHEFVEWLCHETNYRVDFITIDIAHGDSILVKEMIEQIKCHQDNTKIIAGNVGTINGAERLEKWGADAIKVGLGFGKGCSTYNCTGVGTPMFSTLDGVANYTETTYGGTPSKRVQVPIIADGGIREVGDICKALVAGANMVMIGSGFASCGDSPAEIKTVYIGIVDGFKTSESQKVYFGSASAKNKGHNKFVEGWDEVLLPITDLTYFDYYDRINQGILSCMSYAGVEDVKDLTQMEWRVYTK